MMSVPEAIGLVWHGGGDCQAITWSLLGLSMASWVLIAVVVLGITGVIANGLSPSDKS
jgi:disulfide bond formation protein DsbB